MIFLALLCLASSAHAWGPTGHRVVGRIAWERLSPAGRTAVVSLFGAEDALERISNCADVLPFFSSPVNCGGLMIVEGDPHRITKSWHYINFPDTKNPSPALLPKYCPEGKHCAPIQIHEQLKVLSSSSRGGVDKRLALMFLVHLVGDIHQPLHSASEHDDHGGSKKRVLFHGVERTLHELWDFRVTSLRFDDELRLDSSPLAGALIDELARMDTTLWSTGDIVTAAVRESHALAAGVIYAQYEEDAVEDPRVILGTPYHDRMQLIVNRQLQKAGVRLAALIDRAFSGRLDAPREGVSRSIDLSLPMERAKRAADCSSWR